MGHLVLIIFLSSQVKPKLFILNRAPGTPAVDVHGERVLLLDDRAGGDAAEVEEPRPERQ